MRILRSLAGDDSRLGFALFYALRASLGRSPALSFFALCAVTTSVALATGIEISTRSVEATLERTTQALVGPARLEVTGGELGVPDSILEDVLAIPGVRAAAPLITQTFRIAGGSRADHAVKVLGLDFLTDVRSFQVSDGELVVHDPVRLIAMGDSIVVTRQLADRLQLGIGDPIRLAYALGEFDLVVRGLLEPGGLADAYDGQIAAMDVFDLQMLLRRDGTDGHTPTVDRIDVVPEPGVDLLDLAGRIEAGVGEVATVRPIAVSSVFVDRILGSVRLAVWLFGVVGIALAGFLSYATMSISVDRRLGELALLQAIGMETRRVRRLVYVDVLVLGSLGTGMGLCLGLVISRLMTSAFSRISEHLQDVRIETPSVAPWTIAIAVIVGIAISMLGASGPAFRATRARPMEVLRAARNWAPGRSSWLKPTALAGSVAILWIATVVGVAELTPALRLVIVLGGGLALVILGLSVSLALLDRPVIAFLERAVPRIGMLIGTSLLARPNHTAITVGSIAGVVAALVGILVVLSSIESSIHDWIEGRYGDGVVITVGDPFERVDSEIFSRQTIAAIRTTRGIGAVLESYDTSTLYRGVDVPVNAKSMTVLEENGRLPGSTAGSDVAGLLSSNRIAVSEAFSRRFEISAGDAVELSTPRGRQAFEVAAVVPHFGGPSGMIYMDIATFDLHWHRAGADTVVIWPERPISEVREELSARVGEWQPLFFTASVEFARYSERVMDRYLALLYIVAGLVSLLAGVAIINLLFGAIAARRRELALIRVAGGTRRLIGAIVLSDGVIIAALGAAIGLLLGLQCSIPMCDVLAGSLGWSLSITPDWNQLLQVAFAVFVTAALTALYPAWASRRVSSLEMFVPE